MKQEDGRDINPISIINMLIFREISKWFNDKGNEDKIEQLASELAKMTKWDYKTLHLRDYKSLDIKKRYDVWKWNSFTRKGIEDSLGVVIRQKISLSLAAQITREVMWNLISNMNLQLQLTQSENTKKETIDIAKETNKFADQVFKELTHGNIIKDQANLDPDRTKYLTVADSVARSEHLNEEAIGHTLDLMDSTNKLANAVRENPLVDSYMPDKFRELHDKYAKLAKTTGLAIGLNFNSLSEDLQSKVWSISENNNDFANKLGYGLAARIGMFDSKVQESFFDRSIKNSNFRDGFAEGICQAYPSLSTNLRDRIIQIANKDQEFANILLSKLDENFASVPSLTGSIETKIITVEELSFESNVDISFILNPEGVSTTRQTKYPIDLKILVSAPTIE